MVKKDVCLLGIETALGEKVDLQELNEFGFSSYCRANPDVSGLDLAEEAAKKVLANNKLGAEDIDLIVCTTGHMPEYMNWDPSAAVQGRIGAFNAQSIWVAQTCVSSIMSFELIAGKLYTQPNIETVLLVTIDRINENIVDRMNTMRTILADGASAALIKTSGGNSKWLSTATMTDGFYSDLFRYAYEGKSYEPMKEYLASMASREEYQKHLQVFGKKIYGNQVEVFNQALKMAKRDKKDVKWYLYFHDNQNNFKRIAGYFEINTENTNASIAKKYGHMGSTDILVSLKILLDEKKLSSGDVVALMSMGIGWQWGCTLIEIC